MPARGTLKVEILDANDKVVGIGHERYIPGLAADSTTGNADQKDISTHVEKYQITMPGTLAAGTYTIRTSFIEGRDDRKMLMKNLQRLQKLKRSRAQKVPAKRQLLPLHSSQMYLHRMVPIMILKLICIRHCERS